MPDKFFGVSIPSESEQDPGDGPLGVSYIIENKSDLVKSEKALSRLKDLNNKLFINIVGEIHKYLIRISPVHTGKLRGGFTAFLDKYQISYTRQLYDVSLYNSFKFANKTNEHKKYAISNKAISEGQSKSNLEDGLPESNDVTIENEVPYVAEMNFGTSKVQGRHFLQRAFYKGEFWLEKHFQEWFDNMSEAGAIVEPPEVGEIDS